jgi:predicted ATPase/transcriptional regulator with XRE-family HTH domain
VSAVEPSAFGRLLKQLRVAAGLSQEALAERAGLSARGLSDLERGLRRAPQRQTVRRVAEALGLSPAARAALEAAVVRPRGPAPSAVNGQEGETAEPVDALLGSDGCATTDPPIETAGGRPGLAAAPPPRPPGPSGERAAEAATRLAAPGRDRRHNLPIQATPLIGRERDVRAALAQLLRPGVRLLTLTGPAGAGKTRLAVEVAARALDVFEDGALFVDLSPIGDPALVLATVAQALRVRTVPDQSLVARLASSLQGRHLLLLLDNFEQVLDAATAVGDLLAASPGLSVLATSRAALRVRWEQELPVPPLALPDLQPPPDPETLAEAPSVALFVDRARAVCPGFHIGADNARAVAELCVRLDGLPLAIELAAARSRLLPPLALLERLQERVDVLATDARDQPSRHRTLREAIDWSHDLLSPKERALFRRLAVFVGGWTLEAAEAVCAGDEIAHDEVLDLSSQLLGHSLIVAEVGTGERPRYRFLETIRRYAQERLLESGERPALGRQHAAHFLAIADEAAPELCGPGAASWLARLDCERDNLRAALHWSLEGGATQQGARLGGVLWQATEYALAAAELAPHDHRAGLDR